MEKIRHYLQRSGQFIALILQQYQEKHCQKSAESLTYVTLFATVPLMTVTYSMFSIIPAFQGLGDDLQAMIFRQVLPDTGQELIGYLKEFSAEARKLTLAGVAFLVVTAYLMLKNIERNFNAIWGVRSGRKGVANFLLYWAILSLGPLLLGAALAMSTYLASLKIFMSEYDSIGLLTWVFQFVPVLLSAAAFTLLFVAVPNCKVPLKDALIGGVVTAAFFELLKVIFGLIVTNSALTPIYGAFALVPLFLMWVNLIWMVILAGAVLVHTIGSYQIVLKDRGYSDLLAALLVLWEFQCAAANGSSLAERDLIRLGLSSEQWHRIRENLHKNRIITMTHQGEFVLCFDLRYLPLEQLRCILKLGKEMPEQIHGLSSLPWIGAAQAHLGGIDEYMAEHLSLSVADFFADEQVSKKAVSKSRTNNRY